MARVNGKSPNGTVASRERREALRKYQIEQERKEKREQAAIENLWADIECTKYTSSAEMHLSAITGDPTAILAVIAHNLNSVKNSTKE